MDIVGYAGASVREVEISADGSHRCLEPPQEQDVIDLDDVEDDVVEVADDAQEVRFNLHR